MRPIYIHPLMAMDFTCPSERKRKNKKHFFSSPKHVVVTLKNAKYPSIASAPEYIQHVDVYLYIWASRHDCICSKQIFGEMPSATTSYFIIIYKNLNPMELFVSTFFLHFSSVVQIQAPILIIPQI